MLGNLTGTDGGVLRLDASGTNAGISLVETGMKNAFKFKFIGSVAFIMVDTEAKSDSPPVTIATHKHVSNVIIVSVVYFSVVYKQYYHRNV